MPFPIPPDLIQAWRDKRITASKIADDMGELTYLVKRALANGGSPPVRPLMAPITHKEASKTRAQVRREETDHRRQQREDIRLRDESIYYLYEHEFWSVGRLAAARNLGVPTIKEILKKQHRKYPLTTFVLRDDVVKVKEPVTLELPKLTDDQIVAYRSSPLVLKRIAIQLGVSQKEARGLLVAAGVELHPMDQPKPIVVKTKTKIKRIVEIVPVKPKTFYDVIHLSIYWRIRAGETATTLAQEFKKPVKWVEKLYNRLHKIYGTPPATHEG